MLASQAAPEKNPQLQNKQIKHKTDPKSTDICKLAENKNSAFIFCTIGLTMTKVQKFKKYTQVGHNYSHIQKWAQETKKTRACKKYFVFELVPPERYFEILTAPDIQARVIFSKRSEIFPAQK